MIVFSVASEVTRRGRERACPLSIRIEAVGMMRRWLPSFLVSKAKPPSSRFIKTIKFFIFFLTTATTIIIITTIIEREHLVADRW